MVYRIDNRPKKHGAGLIALGIFLGIFITISGILIYNGYKNEVTDNINKVKDFAIKQIPKDSPIIQVVNDKPVDKTVVQSQPVDSSQQNTQPASEPKTIDLTILENSIHQDINNQREQNGLKPLNYDIQVSKIARLHSQDMNQNNYFDHTSPTGVTLQNRMMDAKYPCFPLGENIAEVNLDTPDNIASEAVNEWMNSDEHKTNILESIYFSEGIGVDISGNNVMVTEDFC